MSLGSFRTRKFADIVCELQNSQISACESILPQNDIVDFGNNVYKPNLVSSGNV